MTYWEIWKGGGPESGNAGWCVEHTMMDCNARCKCFNSSMLKSVGAETILELFRYEYAGDRVSNNSLVTSVFSTVTCAVTVSVLQRMYIVWSIHCCCCVTSGWAITLWIIVCIHCGMNDATLDRMLERDERTIESAPLINA